MPRPRLHDDATILDAARDLILEGGAAAATTTAISERSGASSGSMYHRYGSRSQLFAEVWLRSVRAFQAGLFEVVAREQSGLDRAIVAAGWTLEFADRHPADARLIASGNRQSLLDEDLSAELRAEIDNLNVQVVALVRDLACEIFGSRKARYVETVAIAVVDVPLAVARRHLENGTPALRHRALVEGAVRSLLKETS